MAQTKEGRLKVTAKWAGVTVDEYLSNVASGLSLCTKCKVWKPRDEFGNDSTRPDGRARRCFSCSRVKERKSTKGRVSTFLGHRHTDGARQKNSEAHKGKQTRLGMKHTAESRQKISDTLRSNTPRGKDHYNYKGGKSERSLATRRTPEYYTWRMAVFTRDNFTCQKCGDGKGGNLRAHHIKPFAEYPELALDVDNGMTLCATCHDLEHFKPNSTRQLRKLKRGERLY